MAASFSLLRMFSVIAVAPAILVAVLAKKFGVKPRGWEKHAASWHTVADVDSVESMAHAREVKREMKAKSKAK